VGEEKKLKMGGEAKAKEFHTLRGRRGKKEKKARFSAGSILHNLSQGKRGGRIEISTEQVTCWGRGRKASVDAQLWEKWGQKKVKKKKTGN